MEMSTRQRPEVVEDEAEIIEDDEEEDLYARDVEVEGVHGGQAEEALPRPQLAIENERK